MKKALSIFLALTMLLSSFAFVYAEDATTATPISSAEDFATIAADGNYVLTADITLSAGYAGTFSGTFDGGNHIITIGTAANPATQGVFATLGDGAVIKNLIVDGFISANTHAGAFAGVIPENTKTIVEFENCINLADVTGNSVRIGGIIGSAYDGYAKNTVTFTDCVNYGVINSTAGNVPVGGIAGMSSNATFTNCVNYGAVSGGNRTAGMVGWAYFTINISGCVNFADITGSSEAGGMVGTLQNKANTKVDINNCYNSGAVKNGIAGALGSDITTYTINNCINTGTVTNAITVVDTIDNYYLEDSAANALGATKITSADLKGLDLTGFALQSGYEYPLPSGISYKPEEQFKNVVITTAEEFALIHKEWNYTLAKDIDLNTISYTPIAVFSGTLDGAGYTVKIGTESQSATQGLFATLAGGANISNLVIDGNISNSTDHAGALAGASNASSVITISDCINLADVSGKRSAGFIGNADGSKTTKFINCVNYGTIKGIVQNSSSNGGLAGFISYPEFINCVNYGDISGFYKCGGLAGWIYYTINVSDCANFGNISATHDNYEGGLLGFLNDKTNTTGSISNSFNAGSATSGIVGVYNTSPILTITNCVNIGTVTNAITTVETNGNYYLKASSTNALGATEKTSAQLQALSLNGFKKQDDYLYPIPSGITYTPEIELNPIAIGTAAEFVEKIEANPSGSYILTDDIDLGSIGYAASSEYEFSGILNGAGYTVKLGDNATTGIFNAVDGGVIKNITVTGKITASVTSGGIANSVPQLATGEFINCKNYAEVSVSGDKNRGGGIVGSTYESASAKFINCTNYGSISTGAGTQAGGGIVGIASATEVLNCVNYGSVICAQRAGGIMGWSYGSDIDLCSNFGTVSANNAGGIIGATANRAKTYVDSCVNGGKVTVVNNKTQVGSGIIAVCTIFNGSEVIEISNCLNVGEVSNAAITDIENASITDGITVNENMFKVTGCYYLADNGTDTNNSTAKTAEELKTLEMVDFEAPEGIYNVEYPVPVVTDIETNTLTISATEGGSITPSGTINVVYNAVIKVAVTADEEYYVSEALFNNTKTLTENNGIIVTPEVTGDAALEITFSKISDVDVSNAAQILNTFTTTEDDFGWMGSTTAGSVIICGKAESIKPLTIEECGIIIDITSEMGDGEFVLDATGTRTLKIGENKITPDGKYGIFIFNNDFVCGEKRIRAYVKYTNGLVDYSDIKTIEFEQIGVE